MPRTHGKSPPLAGPYSVIDRGAAEDTLFSKKPTELIVLATLEVAIADAHGAYLLVTSPRYANVDDAVGVQSSHWNPPYVAEVIPAPRAVGWRNVGQVLKAIEKAKESGIPDRDTPGERWRPGTALAEIVSTWACGIYEVELVDEITEYKQSWSTPDVMKVYHIMRYRPTLETCNTRALADPESRKGFTYLPLDEDRFTAAVRERPCDRGTPELTFIGKPLVSNLAHILRSSSNRARLRSDAIEIPREDFYAEHDGLLFCGDIANYGAACVFAERHMKGIELVGDSAGSRLRDLATSAINRIFHDAGLAQVHVAGDGFTVAAPLDGDVDAQEVLKRFLDAYARFTGLLDHLTDRIAEHRNGATPGPVLGSRLAIHHGSYRYGKMALAASVVTSFDGAAVTDVSRLEQGLRSITKDPEVSRSLSIDGEGHVVILSNDAVMALGGPEAIESSLGLGTEAVSQSKEAEIAGRIFQLGTSVA